MLSPRTKLVFATITGLVVVFALLYLVFNFSQRGPKDQNNRVTIGFVLTYSETGGGVKERFTVR